MPSPVVIIPGYYGSELSDRLSNELVWLDGYHITHPDLTLAAIDLSTGDADRIVPTGILDDVYVLPFVTPEVYGPLEQFLRDELSYPDDHIYRFYVDWRKSLTIAADDLQRRIVGFLQRVGAPKVSLVAHSHGGLVARQYLASYGPGLVDQLVTMATPYKGMLKTFRAMVEGISFLLFSKRQVRDVSRSFPSAYELLPTDAADGLFTVEGAPDDPFTQGGWTFDAPSAQHLADAARVAKALPAALPVETTLIYGTRLLTTTLSKATGQPLTVAFEDSTYGDGTVPQVSASGNGLTGTIHRFPIPFGDHSTIFRFPATQRVLKDVLLGREELQPHFAAAFQYSPTFLPYSTNPVAVELRDHRGQPLAGATVTLRIGGNDPIALPQTAEGDYYQSLRMPTSGKHFEYEIRADAPSLAQPLVSRGMLFAANT
jgi:pimeloyl-ACP methyl ester carboxylesterase